MRVISGHSQNSLRNIVQKGLKKNKSKIALLPACAQAEEGQRDAANNEEIIRAQQK